MFQQILPFAIAVIVCVADENASARRTTTQVFSPEGYKTI
jgi:hypothetical protein